MFKKFIVVVISVITYVSCTEHFIEKKSSAQQLLESLGKKDFEFFIENAPLT